MTTLAGTARFLLLVALAASGGVGGRALQAQGTSVGGPTRPVPVATRRLPRGTVLRESDFSVARVANQGPPSAVAPGWVTRRVIEAGEPLRPPAVSPAPHVAAGQRVLYVLDGPGLRLTMDGRATTSGFLGERVSVRLGANRRVDGIVTGAAMVSAPDTTRSP